MSNPIPSWQTHRVQVTHRDTGQAVTCQVPGAYPHEAARLAVEACSKQSGFHQLAYSVRVLT